MTPKSIYIFFRATSLSCKKGKTYQIVWQVYICFFSWVCPYYGGKAFFRTFIQDSDHHLQHYRCQPPLALQDLTTKVLETVSLFSMLNVHHVICPCMPCDDASCAHIMLSYMNFPCLRLGFGRFLHDSIHVSCMNLGMDHDLDCVWSMALLATWFMFATILISRALLALVSWPCQLACRALLVGRVFLDIYTHKLSWRKLFAKSHICVNWKWDCFAFAALIFTCILSHVWSSVCFWHVSRYWLVILNWSSFSVEVQVEKRLLDSSI